MSDKLSPSYFSANEIINFIPQTNGTLLRLEARQNAVCISYFEDIDDDEKPYLRRFVWVECRDMDMKDKLLEKAREIMRII